MDGKDLAQAIESLPEILSKKANLETHTNILQAVMRNIAAREVPTYFEMEQAILAAGRVTDKAGALALLRDPAKGTLMDKARLLIFCAISDPSLSSKAAMEEYEAAFVSGCGSASRAQIDEALAACTFSRRLQSLQAPLEPGGAQSSSNAMLSSFLTSAQSRASSLMAKAASFFTKFTPLYITRVVDNLAEGRACPEDDSFCTLDPRARVGAGAGAGAAEGSAGESQKYSEVIVFVVGGGCYTEYSNLQELLKQKVRFFLPWREQVRCLDVSFHRLAHFFFFPSIVVMPTTCIFQGSTGTLRNVLYGCTDLLSGDAFLSQLIQLGKA